jgi:hypothetical protein
LKFAPAPSRAVDASSALEDSQDPLKRACQIGGGVVGVKRPPAVLEQDRAQRDPAERVRPGAEQGLADLQQQLTIGLNSIATKRQQRRTDLATWFVGGSRDHSSDGLGNPFTRSRPTQLIGTKHQLFALQRASASGEGSVERNSAPADSKPEPEACPESKYALCLRWGHDS